MRWEQTLYVDGETAQDLLYENGEKANGARALPNEQVAEERRGNGARI
jgi:hypothetical protein